MTSETDPGLRLKRVYALPEDGDGRRVLVDRLWPRGLRKEKARVDFWPKDIAPSTRLREWFGHDPARFSEFSRLYRAELDMKSDLAGQIVGLLEAGPVTLLYAARDSEHNHARVLLGYLDDRLKTLSSSTLSATDSPAAPVADEGGTHISHS